uniref:MalT-like TPR region domain-containing protein n=1 Tax=Bionectria ochroleuca TaxID=29856 RepID=A0A8H7TWN9_BIOOC
MSGLADLLLNGEENDKEERVKEAADLFEQVLKIKTITLGLEHDETAFAMQKVSSAYLQQHLFAEAEALSKKALSIIHSKYGRDHKKAFGIMEGLAGTLHMQGKAEECESILRDLVEVKGRVLGDAQAVNAIDDLAVHLSREGKKGEAEQYYRIAFSIQKNEGDDEQRTLAIMEALAMLLFSQGKDEEEAKSLSREVVETRTRVDGIEHPATLHSMHVLGKLLSDDVSETGGESLSILEGVVRLRQRTLGFEHEDTLQAAVDLAHVYSKMKDNGKAESTYKEVIRIQRKELGAKHPHTLDTMSRLASFLTRADRMPAAETMLQDVIVGRQQALGESHPRTIESMESLRKVLTEQGKLINATSVAEKIVELQKTSLGKDNEGTMAAMLALARIYTHREEYLEPQVLYQRVIKIITSTSNGNEDILRLAVLRLVELLHLQGKFEEAELVCEDVFLRIAKIKEKSTTDLEHFKTSIISDLYEMDLSVIANKLIR